MAYRIFSDGLDDSFIDETSSAPPINVTYKTRVTAISGITGQKLYDYVDDTGGITEVFPLQFAPYVPPSGTNLLYVGLNQATDVRFYDETGTEKTITAIYLGSTVVWQQ